MCVQLCCRVLPSIHRVSLVLAGVLTVCLIQFTAPTGIRQVRSGQPFELGWQAGTSSVRVFLCGGPGILRVLGLARAATALLLHGSAAGQVRYGSRMREFELLLRGTLHSSSALLLWSWLLCREQLCVVFVPLFQGRLCVVCMGECSPARCACWRLLLPSCTFLHAAANVCTGWVKSCIFMVTQSVLRSKLCITFAGAADTPCQPQQHQMLSRAGVSDRPALHSMYIGYECYQIDVGMSFSVVCCRLSCDVV